jgi:AbrB family looped-hinge helix DNA binding protein
MDAMERQTATVDRNGQLLLPAEVQSALSILPGSRVEIIVHDKGIRLLLQDDRRLPEADAMRILGELRGMFAGEPSIEDEYRRDRDRDAW